MAHPILFALTVLLHVWLAAGVYDLTARFYHWCRSTTWLQMDAQQCRAVVVTIVACCLLLSLLSFGAPLNPQSWTDFVRLLVYVGVTASGAYCFCGYGYPLICQDWDERMEDLQDDCGCKKD